MAVLDFSKTNKKNTKNRGDYGVRVARPGFDANYCAQNQLLFNSNWPILQICKVVDKGPGVTVDEDTGRLIEPDGCSYAYYDETNQQWISQLPASMIIASETSIGSVAVGKKTLFYTALDRLYRNNDRTLYIHEFAYKKFNHNLGYVPFYIYSKNVSDLDNYIILTSIDLTKDVDYPYTEGPLPMISVPGDYGVSSTSIFGKNVPGLSSGMFSKLVQCVKTTDSSRWIIGTEKILCWSPFNKASEFKAGVVNKYEAFSFSAYNCPFLDSSTGPSIANLGVLNTDTFGDGPYYSKDRVVSMLALEESSLYSAAAAYSNIAQAPLLYNKASMVILRSPMVSPEYEEVIV